MAQLFHLSEVYAFAVEREQEAYDLYSKMSQKVHEPAMKDLFASLAAEEAKHKDFFGKLTAAVEKKQTPGVPEDDEYMLYVKEMIDSARTRSKDAAKLDAGNLEAVIAFALDREKDSILFYNGLKEFVGKEALSAIAQVIQEEGRHIIRLVKIRRDMLD